MIRKINIYILFLLCLFALIGCNVAYNKNEVEITKLSDARFNGDFQWGADNNYFGYRFNGTNIVEYYMYYKFENTGENWYDSWFYSFEINNGSYRTRLIQNNEYVGDWDNWLEYNFNEDDTELILQHDITAAFPPRSDIVLVYMDYNKL